MSANIFQGDPTISLPVHATSMTHLPLSVGATRREQDAINGFAPTLNQPIIGEIDFFDDGYDQRRIVVESHVASSCIGYSNTPVMLLRHRSYVLPTLRPTAAF